MVLKIKYNRLLYVYFSHFKYISGGFKMVEGHCMKCKEKREIKNPKQVKMQNGRDAVNGLCTECGTKMFKIGKLV
ncbi:MAG: hypothetical protein UT08_C0022G0011 [Candidatus Woesebacteria bacterium GW2011_GWB1_38_8]|uniref:DUF5679 domain-containing protein n=1 Tax=Candidatus Woesebacteria bacterium GW2011_GWB1_38_8 TaxID=1618570 RepID=A0A0G0NE65_9BACT|nr:MAG: hypothetical protein UT08_C0022G0011 [Candidatus Woesebacteria bacterium GW2011_GWB1_38_8]